MAPLSWLLFTFTCFALVSNPRWVGIFPLSLLKSKTKEEKPTPVVEVKKEPVKSKLSYKEQRALELLEKEIADLEASVEKLTNELNNPEASHEELIALSKKIEETNTLLDEKSMQWITLTELAWV